VLLLLLLLVCRREDIVREVTEVIGTELKGGEGGGGKGWVKRGGSRWWCASHVTRQHAHALAFGGLWL